MVDRLRSAIVSTPVSDGAVTQEDKTTVNKDHEQKTSEKKTAQGAGCPDKDPIRLSRASSRPAGHRDDAPVQNSPSLVASRLLGRQQPLEIQPPLRSLSPPCATHEAITNSHLGPKASGLSGEYHDVDAALVEILPQESGDKTQLSFLSLPAEIRNMIYSHALHWPDCVDIYRSFYRQMHTYPVTDKPHYYQRNLNTPTILLLCRRITKESLPVLKSRCLVIDRLPPFLPSGLMRITDFIGRQTLQSLQHIDIRIGLGEGPLGSGWIWTRLLDDVLSVLSERNAFIRLRLLVRMCNDQMVARWDQEGIYNNEIRKVRITATSQNSPH